MPELPEVETVVRTLRPKLIGRTLRSIDLKRTDILTPTAFNLIQALTNKSVRAIDRRGKKILVRLADDNSFCIHLGMTGQLTVEPAAAPLKPHTHLTITL